MTHSSRRTSLQEPGRQQLVPKKHATQQTNLHLLGSKLGSNDNHAAPYRLAIVSPLYRNPRKFSPESKSLTISGEAEVAHTGFEPVISALRGRRPGPLDECAICCGGVSHRVPYSTQQRRRLSSRGQRRVQPAAPSERPYRDGIRSKLGFPASKHLTGRLLSV